MNDSDRIPITCPGILWLHSLVTINAETHIIIRPTAAFRVRCILIPDKAARDIAIRNIRIGVNSQLARDTSIAASEFTWKPRIDLEPLRKEYGPHPMNASLFAQLIHRRPEIRLDTITCAKDLAFIVEPYDPAAHTPEIFEAFLLGTMIGPVPS